MVTRLALLIVGTSVIASFALADDSAANDWNFEITPYIFGSSLSGKTGIDQVIANVDSSFSDILDHLDSGFMAMFEARKGPWGFGFDGVYFRLAGEGASSWHGPAGLTGAAGSLEVTVTEQIYQPSINFRYVDSWFKLDAIGAARYTQLDTDLNLVVTTGGLLPGGARGIKASKQWWDPAIGLRAIFPFAEHWSFVGYGDIGGFGVGSDITYQAIAAVNWQISKTFIAKTGYRYFYQDYENQGFVWKMAAHGLYLGLGIAF